MALPGIFSDDAIQRAKRVTTLVLDLDGVLTDGRMIYAEYGDELKCFDVQDGTGLVFWKRTGLRTAVITAKQSKLVTRRFKELPVDFLAQKALQKLPEYERMCKKWSLADSEVCAIGDDLLELPILRRVGLAVAVSNAVDEVKRVSHYITRRQGGRGAVREVIESILKAKGLWDSVLERYR